MIVFICLDDNNGMLFNHRRLSSDKAVIEDMLSFAGKEKIRMNLYSSKLFDMAAERVIIEEDPLENAFGESYCFLETFPLERYVDYVGIIVAYYWNRVYPADVHLDIDLKQDWETVECREFGGNSHEKITRKVYRRREC